MSSYNSTITIFTTTTIQYCSNESSAFDNYHQYVNYGLLCLNILAACLNTFVIFAARKLYRNTNDAVHMLIISMTTADLLLTGFSSPMETLVTQKVIQNEVLCYAQHVCAWLGLGVSGLSLSLLNLEKLLYFRWPLNYDSMISEKLCLSLTLGVWALCGTFVAVVWSLPDVIKIDHDTCISGTVPWPWYEMNTVLFCIVPVFSSAVLSIYLCQLTRQKRREHNRRCPQQSNTSRAHKLKAFVFIFATTMWTAVSLLPCRVFNLFQHAFVFIQLSCEMRIPVQWVAWIFFYMLMLNPVVNPFITVTIYAPYRTAFLKMVHSVCSCCKRGRAAGDFDTSISMTQMSNVRSRDTSEMRSLAQQLNEQQSEETKRLTNQIDE